LDYRVLGFLLEVQHPLNSALFKRNLEVARFLVEHGADVSTQKKDGTMGSCASGVRRRPYRSRTAPCLERHRGNSTPSDESTPLHWASSKGDVAVVQILAVKIPRCVRKRLLQLRVSRV